MKNLKKGMQVFAEITGIVTKLDDEKGICWIYDSETNRRHKVDYEEIIQTEEEMINAISEG